MKFNIIVTTLILVVLGICNISYSNQTTLRSGIKLLTKSKQPE